MPPALPVVMTIRRLCITASNCLLSDNDLLRSHSGLLSGDCVLRTHDSILWGRLLSRWGIRRRPFRLALCSWN